MPYRAERREENLDLIRSGIKMVRVREEPINVPSSCNDYGRKPKLGWLVSVVVEKCRIARIGCYHANKSWKGESFDISLFLRRGQIQKTTKLSCV